MGAQVSHVPSFAAAELHTLYYRFGLFAECQLSEFDTCAISFASD